jgi:hypothetical protein
MTDATAFPGDTPEPPGLPELTFASGLPGFPDARRFVLVRIGDAAPASCRARPSPRALRGSSSRRGGLPG